MDTQVIREKARRFCCRSWSCSRGLHGIRTFRCFKRPTIGRYDEPYAGDLEVIQEFGKERPRPRVKLTRSANAATRDANRFRLSTRAPRG